MRGIDLKRFIESSGHKHVYHTLVGLLVDGEVKPEDFSLRELWEACIGPVSQTLPYAMQSAGEGFLSESAWTMEAAAGTNLFQTVTGELVAQKIIEAYDNTAGFIGDDLVTVMPSKIRNERIAGFIAAEGPKEIEEGHPYDESTLADKYVTTVEAKKGRILSITEEAIYFDQTGQLLMRAASIGEQIRQERERVIVRGVIDADYSAGVSGVYRPSGTLEELYPTDASNNNYISTVTALTDWTDIQEVLTYHATNVTDDRTGGGQPIVWMPKILLTSVADSAVAARIVSATEVRSGSVANEQTIAGNPHLNKYAPMSSPFVDQDNADDWFLGDFKRQFIWKEIWPIQVFRQGRDSDMAFERDVVARFKARYYGGINATDERWVVKVNGA